MAIGRFILNLFGQEASEDYNDLNAQKEAFRTVVIQAARNLGSQSEHILDENDPLVLHLSSDGEVKGYVDLNNAFSHLKAYPQEDAEKYIQQFARIMIANEKELSVEDVSEDAIVVVIRPEEYIRAVKEHNDDLMVKHLCGELHCFFMLDTPDAMRGLGKSEFPDKTEAEIHALALKNVRNFFDNLTSDASLEGATLYYVEGNTFLTSSLILLDEFWEHVERSYGVDFIFALPRKDQLFVFDAKNPQHIDYARHMINVTFEENFNLLSAQIFRRRNGALELVE